MKTRILLLFGLILAGCVPSWNPLYTEKDVVFDPLLIGAWKPVKPSEGSKETWLFTKCGEKFYQLQQTDEQGRKANFEVRLVKLGEHQFLDFYLSKVEGDNVNLNAWASFSLAPAHLILKVEQISSTLKIAAMNPDWIKKFVAEHPDAIAHRVVFDGDIILTANTSDLQKFIGERADGEGLFGGPMELKHSATREDRDWSQLSPAGREVPLGSRPIQSVRAESISPVDPRKNCEAFGKNGRAF